MTQEKEFIATLHQGWRDNHKALRKAIAPLTAEQLALRVSANARSVREIAAHVIAVRARWFSFSEEEERAFKTYWGWDRPDAKAWSPEELAEGLEATWKGIEESIARWTPEDWKQTWPGELEL